MAKVAGAIVEPKAGQVVNKTRDSRDSIACRIPPPRAERCPAPSWWVAANGCNKTTKARAKPAARNPARREACAHRLPRQARGQPSDHWLLLAIGNRGEVDKDAKRGKWAEQPAMRGLRPCGL